MRLIDAEGLFSAIRDKADDIAKAKDRAEGSWVTYYEGVADGLLLAKGLIADEKTIEIHQNEIYQKLDALYKNLDATRRRDYLQSQYYQGRFDAMAKAFIGIAAILEEAEEDGID